MGEKGFLKTPNTTTIQQNAAAFSSLRPQALEGLRPPFRGQNLQRPARTEPTSRAGWASDARPHSGPARDSSSTLAEEPDPEQPAGRPQHRQRVALPPRPGRPPAARLPRREGGCSPALALQAAPALSQARRVPSAPRGQRVPAPSPPPARRSAP